MTFKQQTVATLILVFSLLLINESYSQIILEDVNGKDIFTNLTASQESNTIGNFSVNTANKSLVFDGFVKLDNEIKPKKFLTFRLKGKATNNVSTIFSSGELNSGASCTGYFQIDLSFQKVISLSTFFQLLLD